MLNNNTEFLVNEFHFRRALESDDSVLFQPYFEFLAANIIRSKEAFTIVFVSVYELNYFSKHYGFEQTKYMLSQMNHFLREQTRNSDLIFQSPLNNEWVFLLPRSAQEEAKFFLKRVFESVPNILVDQNNEIQLALSASIVEINNSNVSFEEVYRAGREGVLQALEKGPYVIEIVKEYREREVEKIKVSIIEGDAITQEILETLLQRTAVEFFDLDIQTFDDGDHFLQSNWYQSGHTHIVLISDVLPKKTGMEVLFELREMPNNMKYIIFMLSTGKAEEEMIYAYEAGVDEFFTKPFNLKLVDAQIKRWLKRLR